MRKHILLLCLFLTSFVPAVSAGQLYEELSRAGEVKVYVAPPTDPAGKSGLDMEKFRAAIVKALEERKSVRFKSVETEAEARIKIETAVKGYTFSLTDPIDMLVGVGGTAMDAAQNDHYVSTETTYAVKDAKTGSVKWSDTVLASITDATMTEEQARERILDRASAQFVKTAFGKK